MKRFLLFAGYFSVVSPAFAASWGTSCLSNGDVATLQCLEPIFQNVVGAVMALTGVALFVMLVIGGYNFLLSGGDQKKLEAARGTLTNAVIGLVVIVAAYLIIKIVSLFTGVDTVTQFTIPKWQ